MHSSKIKSTAARYGLMQILCGGVPILLTAAVMITTVVSVSPVLIEATSPGMPIPVATSEQSRGAVRQICASADGQQAHVVRHPTQFQLVDVKTGEVQRQRMLTNHFCTPPQRVKSPGDAAVYADTVGCHLQSLWKDEPPIHVIASQSEFNGIAASAESTLVAVHNLNVLQLWSVIDGTVHAKLELKCAISTVEWSPDGDKLMVLLGDGRLQSRDGRTLKLLQSQPTPLLGGGRLTWASAGRHVAAYNQSGCVATWNLTTDVVELHQTGFLTLMTIAISPDGDCLVVPDAYRDVWIFPISGDDRQRQYLGTAGGQVSALCLADGGESLLLGTLEGNVECWSMVTGLPLWTCHEDMMLSTPKSNPSPTQTEWMPPFAQRGPSYSSSRS